MLITDTDTLAATCAQLARSDYITIDTEFLREKTYYPQLCLIQMASEDTACMVDPLAKGIDLAPLFALLENKAIVKVFHSGKQDIEIFYQLTRKIPTPVFDTQIAAMVCGFGAAASYATLVSELAGQRLDKSSRFTDWSKRPLSQRQLDYALGDVTHLRVIYKKLLARLEDTGRSEWVKEELSSLLAPETYHSDLEKLWRKICPKGCSAESAGIIKGLIYWREEQAILQDKPRSHVLKDQTIQEIAALRPQDMATLESLRSLGRKKSARRMELLDAILSSPPVSEKDIAGTGIQRSSSARYKPAMELLRVLLAQVAAEYDVAEKLIASADDLYLIAIGRHEESHAMRGWRYDIFGKPAQDLCEGRIGLTIAKRAIHITPLPQPLEDTARI